MLTREENDLLTQTGPGTPCGELYRSYWTPAALSEELPKGGSPIPIRLLSEDLVMFRDEDGRVGLLDLHCSHRATDLSYGRIEDGGLRCVYHGWLYDVNGKCLQTPAEPPGSHLNEFVRHKAYPCLEKGGVIFTYMGRGEPPLLPNYEVLSVPEENRLMTKHYTECNYLQGLEGSEDTTHVRFLHRFFGTEGGSEKRNQHPTERPNGGTYVEGYTGPVKVEENDFSVWAQYSNGVWAPEYTFPSLCLTGGGPQAPGNGYQMYWRVPIDDTHHWLYAFAYRREGAIPEEHRYSRTWAIMSRDYHLLRNSSNRYLQDRDEQRTSTFSGMGSVFVPQDAMANETQGPVQDRTKELLGVGDMVIAAWRRMVLKAIQTVQEGGEAPGLIHDPRVNEADPLFLKRNAPPEDGELESILSDTRGRWVKSLGRVALPV